MLTEDEDAHVRQLHAEFADHPTVVAARAVAVSDFISPEGMGRLRIQEHPLYSNAVNLERLAAELKQILVAIE